jgi:hypothetical protein
MKQTIHLRGQARAFGRCLVTGGGLAIAVGLLSAGALSRQEASVQDASIEKVASARTALEKWVETRRLVSKERRDWALGREILLDQIALREREIAGLRESIGRAEDELESTDEKRAGVEQRAAALRATAASLKERVTGAETRLRALLVRLPEHVLEHLEPITQKLPEDPNTTEVSLSTRYRNVIGILNEINKFQREVSLTSEVRELRDATTAEVAAFYLGIGQGYYVTPQADAAGIGAATASGWAWKPANDAAAAISHAVKILNGEQTAEFVQLPVRID